MRTLASVQGKLLNATAYGTLGPDDLSVWPWVRIPSIPMTLMIGATGLRRFGVLERRTFIEEHFQAEFIGPRRVPNLMVEFGPTADFDNIDELIALSYALGPAAIEAGLGPQTLSTLGDDWQTRAREVVAKRLGDEVLAELDELDADMTSAKSGSDEPAEDADEEAAE